MAPQREFELGFSTSYRPCAKMAALNYYFVHIQKSLANLVRDNKFFIIFVSKTRSVRLF